MSAPAIRTPHRAIWAIAGPAIIANSSAPLVGLVDTWVIGHLPGAKFLAAVSIGAMIFSYIYWAFGFLRMSTTGLVAQAHGRGDEGLIARTLARAFAMALGIGVLILVFATPLKATALTFLDPPTDTVPLFGAYFDIRVWSLPAALLSYGINGYLIGTAKAKLSLYLQLMLNILNGALNLLFVLGFGLGVEGVAFGTLIAEWSAVALGLVFVHGTLGLGKIKAAFGHAETFAPDKMKKLMSVNGFIFLRTLLLILAFALITREAAALGAVPLAANHVLNTFMMLIALGLDGFAYAAEALAGAAFGRSARTEFRAWVGYGLLWSGLAATVYAAAFYLFGAKLVQALTDLEAVRIAAIAVLPVMALLPLVGTWCYLFDGVFIGATAARAMFGTASVAVATFWLSLEPLTSRFGLEGLWLAVCVFLGMRGLAQALWYPRLERQLDSGTTS